MPSDLECRSRGSRLFHCTVLLVVDDGGGDGNAGDGVGAFLSGFNVQREAARGRTGLKSDLSNIWESGMSQNVTAVVSSQRFRVSDQ